MTLRDFQVDLKAGIYQAWDEGAKIVMAVSPTGSGKTVVMADIVKELNEPTCAMVHRQELVAQIAQALNREELPHAIIAPATVVKEIIHSEMELHGKSYYNPRAAVRVASTLSLKNYQDTRWVDQCTRVVTDEGHHVLADNVFGQAVKRFTNARGVFFTAHAHRADGAGLGRHADGLVDRLVIGPHGRALINRGFLTDYRVICPPAPDDLSLDFGEVGDNGEYNMRTTAATINASKQIVGDMVGHYRRFAEGESWITFAVNVEAAQKITDAYNAVGIPAALITAKTPIGLRAQIMKRFRRREIIMLVNVDCLGEGTDVPGCTGISMGRPTASFQLCAQQFGRMLRVLVSDDLGRIWHALEDEQRVHYIAHSTKPKGILIDHVGNVALAGGTGKHGLPDRYRTYSLDRRERRSKQADDAIPLTTCLNPTCLQAYERTEPQCPFCTTKRPAPKSRGAPEHVDGDLFELDPEVLREMLGEADRIMQAPRIPGHATGAIAGAIQRRHIERQAAQHTLREAIALYGGWQRHHGRPDSEGYKRFWFQFGTDVASAMALNAKDATELEARIRVHLDSNNVRRAS